MLLHRKKRGQVMWVAATIIVLAGFFVSAAVARHIASHTEEKQAEITCRSSASWRTNTLLGVEYGPAKAQMHIVPLLCQTLDREIEDGTAREVMKQVADLMARCKWMFLDGIYNNIIGHEDGDLCFPCYTIHVNKITDKDIIGVAEFEEFLMKEKYKDNMTYMNYLTYFQGIPCRLRMVGTIAPKHIYQVQYADYSRGVWYVLGDDKGANGIFLIDPNDPPETWYRRYQYFLSKIPLVKQRYEPCVIVPDLRGR